MQTTALTNGQLWNPMLTFINRRDLTSPIEGVVYVYNTGVVVVIQRYIAAYSVALDIRDYPFDTQARPGGRVESGPGVGLRVAAARAEVIGGFLSRVVGGS